MTVIGGAGALGELSRAVLAERESETGGWVQFDWMLYGGSLKAQPIGSHLVCFKNAKRCLSKNYLFLFCEFSDVTHHILENYLDEEILVPFLKSKVYVKMKKILFLNIPKLDH